MSKEKKGNPKKPNNKSSEIPIQEFRLVPLDTLDKDTDPKDEIDLIEVLGILLSRKLFIIRATLIGILLGIFVVTFSTKEYESYATLMPEYGIESQGGASSLLKQYGGLIGISSGTYSSSSNAIRIDLYPQIVSSLSFQHKLGNQEFYFQDYDTTTSIYNYFLNIKSPGFFGYLGKYTIGIPQLLKNKLFSNSKNNLLANSTKSEIIELSKEQMQVIEQIRGRVNVSLNELSGIITVRARMDNPRLAADVAKYTIDELTSYLIEYRTEKVIRDLEFIREQLNSAERRFNEAQIVLADFDDSNQGNLTARAKTERQRLQSEYSIAYDLYNSLTQQYEQAKLKVQEETPVFKALQPVQVPVKDENSGSLIVLICMFVSFIGGTAWVLIKHYLNFQELQNNLKSYEG